MGNRSLSIMLLGFVGLMGLGISSQLIKAFNTPTTTQHDLGYKIGFALPSLLLGVLCIWLLYKAYTLWNKQD
ncbi:MAG: hypothetical protein U0V74_09165 [Chitinophagales bacterium]